LSVAVVPDKDFWGVDAGLELFVLLMIIGVVELTLFLPTVFVVDDMGKLFLLIRYDLMVVLLDTIFICVVLSLFLIVSFIDLSSLQNGLIMLPTTSCCCLLLTITMSIYIISS
jgi:hypothetical protein